DGGSRDSARGFLLMPILNRGTDDGGGMAEMTEEASGGDAARLNKRNVRGSTLLLVGRLVSLLFTVVTQVVIVRSLSKSDYGAFALAFTLTAAGRVLLSLGQGRLLSRFLAKYEEERDYA